MNDAALAYAKRRGESYTQDMSAYVTAHKNGQADQLPALSPMAVLQSEVIGTAALLLADIEAMLQGAGAAGDLQAVAALTRGYIGLKRASAAFAHISLP
jgi:hypothetical protein